MFIYGKREFCAFTLSEVLLTLTIIGVVAAISLPSLLESTSQKTWDTKRKALQTRMATAIAQMEDISGYGTFTTDNNGNTTADNAAESFLLQGLSKVYKIKNFCDENHLDKCGVPKNFTGYTGSSVTLPANMSSFNHGSTIKKTKAAGFENKNGEKFALYYNPDCHSVSPNDTTRYPKDTICANFIYDLNGLDGPNMMGKDMGILAIVYDENKDPEVVAPAPYNLKAGTAPSYSDSGADAATVCKNLGNNYTLPDVNELTALNFNSITGTFKGVTGSVITPGKTGKVWHLSTNTAVANSRTTSADVYCVKE